MPDKPGYKSTEFLVTLAILFLAFALTVRGDITVQQFLDVAWKLAGLYGLSRGLKKLGEGRNHDSSIRLS